MRKHIKTLGIKKLWEWLTHPHAFAYVFMFLSIVVYGIVCVDLPTKKVTPLQHGLNTYLENWRLHSNATKIYLARDEKDRLKDECAELRSTIKELQVLEWKLMAIAATGQERNRIKIERERIKVMRGNSEKKLVGAELARSVATQLYKDLVASR